MSMEIKCEFCETTNPRDAYKSCVECEAHFCQLCLETCHSRGPYRKHSLVEPQTLAECLISKCEKHQERLKLCCLTCMEPVCLECKESGWHREHKTVIIKEGKDKMKAILLEHLHGLTTANSSPNDAEAGGFPPNTGSVGPQTADDAVITSVQELLQSIKNANEKFLKATDEKFEKLTDELLIKKRSVLDEQEEEQKKVTELISKALNSYQKEDNIFTLISVNKEVSESFKKLKTMNISFDPTCGIPSYRFDAQKTLEKMTLQLGSLEIKPDVTDVKTAESPPASSWDISPGTPSRPRYRPAYGSDTMLTRGTSCCINTRLENICAMPEYEDQSTEELRLEDYKKRPRGLTGCTCFYKGSLFGSNEWRMERPSGGFSFRSTTPTTRQGEGFSFGGPPTFANPLRSTTTPAQEGSSVFGSWTSTSNVGFHGFHTTANETNCGGLFGRPATTTQASSGDLFGRPATTQASSGGLFGSSGTATQQSSGGLFGRPATTQGNSSSPFGDSGTATQQSTGGLFLGRPAVPTQASTGSLFLSSTAATKASSGSLFGSSTTTTQQSLSSPFGGSAATTQQSSGGLFGSSTVATQASSGGLFGSSTVATQVSSGGLFGSSTVATQASSGGLFGSSGTATQQSTGGLFGRPATTHASSSSPFGSSATTTQASTDSLFGRPATTTQASSGGLFLSSTVVTQASSSSPFGSSATTTHASSSSPFGSSAATTQANSSSPFGSSTAATQASSSSPFGSSTVATQASSGGLFGSSGAATKQGTGGFFGSSTVATQASSGGLFGSSAGTTHASSSSPFGSSTVATQASSGSLFGTPATPQQTSGSLFGRTVTTAQTGFGCGGFGSTATSRSGFGGGFGSTATPQSSFGGSAVTPNPTAGGLFGRPTTVPQPEPINQQNSTCDDTVTGTFGTSTAQPPARSRSLFGGSVSRTNAGFGFSFASADTASQQAQDGGSTTEEQDRSKPEQEDSKGVESTTLPDSTTKDENDQAVSSTSRDKEDQESGPTFVTSSMAEFGFGFSNMCPPLVTQNEDNRNEWRQTSPDIITNTGSEQSNTPRSCDDEPSSPTITENTGQESSEDSGPIYITQSMAGLGFGCSNVCPEFLPAPLSLSSNVATGGFGAAQAMLPPVADVPPAQEEPKTPVEETRGPSPSPPRDGGPVYISSHGAFAGFGASQAYLPPNTDLLPQPRVANIPAAPEDTRSLSPSPPKDASPPGDSGPLYISSHGACAGFGVSQAYLPTNTDLLPKPHDLPSADSTRTDTSSDGTKEDTSSTVTTSDTEKSEKTEDGDSPVCITSATAGFGFSTSNFLADQPADLQNVVQQQQQQQTPSIHLPVQQQAINPANRQNVSMNQNLSPGSNREEENDNDDWVQV